MTVEYSAHPTLASNIFQNSPTNGTHSQSSSNCSIKNSKTLHSVGGGGAGTPTSSPSKSKSTSHPASLSSVPTAATSSYSFTLNSSSLPERTATNLSSAQTTPVHNSHGNCSCPSTNGCHSSTTVAGNNSNAGTPQGTGTRLPQCCQMTAAGAAAAAAAAAAVAASAAAGNAVGCKKLTKFDPRLGPSPYRQLLPIALCILTFATVFSILIVYMDTTEIRHQQFRLNMSRDYELFGVQQDDPTLIAFLREIHMKKYPMHFLKNAPAEHLNFTNHHELTPEMAHYVADLVGGKLNGAAIQSLTGQTGNLMTAPWLSETLNWAGVIIEPEPRRYFTLRKQNVHRPKMQVVHACVSPNQHPKEVTLHNEEDSDVRINSLFDEETSWFNSRVKCFPLYTIMLACNRVDYDLLSLGVYGRELEILQTIPFDKVYIEVISIHIPENHENTRSYIQSITQFLVGKSYKFQKNFGRNYFYQKLNSNRSRKKEIQKKP